MRYGDKTPQRYLQLIEIYPENAIPEIVQNTPSQYPNTNDTNPITNVPSHPFCRTHPPNIKYSPMLMCKCQKIATFGQVPFGIFGIFEVHKLKFWSSKYIFDFLPHSLFFAAFFACYLVQNFTARFYCRILFSMQRFMSISSCMN